VSLDPAAFDHVVDLVLCTSGTEIDVWDEYVISLDMLSPGNAWTFAFFRSAARRTTWDVIKRTVRLGDDVALSIDNACQLTGRVESIRTEADRRNGATVILSGRDLAGPAMDFDADPTFTVRNLTLGEALPQVFGPLGIPVRVVDSAADIRVTSGRARGPRAASRTAPRTVVVDRAHPVPGQKVWAFADSIVSRLGYLCWVAPSADSGLALVVDVPRSTGSPQYLFTRREVPDGDGAYEGNILSGGETLSSKGVPTTISVFTGSDRGAQLSARSAVTTINVGLGDPVVTRGLALDPFPSQPRYVRSQRARTRARAGQEASRAILEAMRGFRTYECVVRGHGQTLDEQRLLYALNTVARVRDDVCLDAQGRPLDEDMLITAVEFRRSRAGGTLSRLRMVPLGALLIEPEST
jgi:hypothetical protein